MFWIYYKVLVGVAVWEYSRASVSNPTKWIESNPHVTVIQVYDPV